MYMYKILTIFDMQRWLVGPEGFLSCLSCTFQGPPSAHTCVLMSTTIECQLVGNNGVGKTTLISSFVNGSFPASDLSPIVFDNCSVEMTSPEGLPVSLQLWDCYAGSDGWEGRRVMEKY
ncbi:hypothetical protein DL96DRAFT_481398 [Flagelloscypha sp. PMI_526]|nr:hypothetical protein DL96DRAFT_481398 [Flagelloscypha sp. PMI_526]